MAVNDVRVHLKEEVKVTTERAASKSPSKVLHHGVVLGKRVEELYRQNEQQQYAHRVEIYLPHPPAAEWAQAADDFEDQELKHAARKHEGAGKEDSNRRLLNLIVAKEPFGEE